MSDIDLKKIYSKYFDESGKMKQSGKSIFSEGMKGLSEGPKTLTEQGFFQPKTLRAAETIGKAARATKIGKIAAGVAAAGLAAKEYLKSKMEKPEEKQVEDVEKKSKGGMNKSTKGYGQARKSGMGLEDENISLGKGKDYIKDLL